MELSILGYKCIKCGTVHYPNRTLCKNCGHNEFAMQALPKTGKLLTFTHLHNLAADFEVPSMKFGIVELDNGNRLTGQMKIDNPQTGMRVQVKIETVRTPGYKTLKGAVFYPA
jgi:hypothetical protein